VITTLLINFVHILAVAFTLGLGFWLSKQLTGKFEELLLLSNRKRMQELMNS